MKTKEKERKEKESNLNRNRMTFIQSMKGVNFCRGMEPVHAGTRRDSELLKDRKGSFVGGTFHLQFCSLQSQRCKIPVEDAVLTLPCSS